MTDIVTSTSRRALLSGALGLGGLAALAPAAAAGTPRVPVESSSDYFLKLDGVAGESTDRGHTGEIELLTWGTGVSTVASPLFTAGGGAGKSKPADLTFVARTSKASPKLFQVCATGKHLKTATLSVRRNGDTPVEYLVITLEDVLVTSYQVAPGENDGYPIDVAALSYARLRYSYRPQLPNGELGEPITFGFDFAANKAF